MNKSMKRQETLAGWTFMAPALIIFTALVIFPIIMSLFLSFTEWNFLSGIKGIEWANLDNFQKLLYPFLKLLYNQFYYR